MRAIVLAEFLSPEEAVRAIRALRASGYVKLDAFAPYPIKDLPLSLGLPRSRLGWAVFACGLVGAAIAYLIQWYCNAYDYPLDVGGRPLHSAPAFIPITFEMGVLAAGVAAFVLYFYSTGLPELYSPVFDVPGFERAMIDRFWVGVDERDPAFDPGALERALMNLGARRVAFARPRAR